MNWLLSFVFVTHRQGCRIAMSVYCGRCENDLPMVLAILFDLAAATLAVWVWGIW